MRKIAVVGSRTKNKDDHYRCGRIVGYLFRIINKNDSVIISGGANSGADRWAKDYSNKYGFRYLEAPAFWQGPELFGQIDKSAGPFRNETIAMFADLALVVWDGKSPGTANIMKCFEKHGVPFWTVQL